MASLVEVGQVADDGRGASVQQIAHGRQAVPIARVHHHLVALCEQAVRSEAPEPVGRAGDDHTRHQVAPRYSSSVTCSPHVTGLPLSSFCCMAMWTMKRFGAAPCQWFSPGWKKTRSPGRMVSTGPPSR